MTTKPDSPTPAPQVRADSGPRDQAFEMCFTSTPRGARLARRLAAVRLDAWGLPYGTEAHDDIVLIVAELTANAVRHGHVPGRDFHLRLHVDAHSGTARVEVTDTRAERLPRRPAAVPNGSGAEEAGRGLLLVSHLATRWDWHPRADGPGKTVWAECAL
ncbi:ATP-binding protein [Streptomyces sp. NBC_00391]|uniref:ATP-binding protein n=1 Tax=Streptomyces sp. NBC_00391 TaxID=2903647 RepID=UPI002E1C1E2D